MECGGEVALVHNMTIACVCLPALESFLSCDPYQHDVAELGAGAT